MTFYAVAQFCSSFKESIRLKLIGSFDQCRRDSVRDYAFARRLKRFVEGRSVVSYGCDQRSLSSNIQTVETLNLLVRLLGKTVE